MSENVGPDDMPSFDQIQKARQMTLHRQEEVVPVTGRDWLEMIETEVAELNRKHFEFRWYKLKKQAMWMPLSALETEPGSWFELARTTHGSLPWWWTSLGRSAWKAWSLDRQRWFRYPHEPGACMDRNGQVSWLTHISSSARETVAHAHVHTYDWKLKRHWCFVMSMWSHCSWVEPTAF